MKKQKIEKRPTRARRAVKSVVIMLCALLISNMLGGGHLTRAMALRDGEQRYGVYEKTHEITSLPAENIYKTLRVTLMASENVTYCGASHFYTLLGWQDDFGVPLDCSDGESIHAGWWDMARNGVVRDIFYWGRVDDAAVDSAFVRVRFRKDGLLSDRFCLSSSMAPNLSVRVKVLGRLDVGESRLPQDGSWAEEIDGVPYDFRISVLPSMYGETIVIRILSGRVNFIEKNELGMRREQESLFRRALSKGQGLILTTGPTGSGKTSTLYAALKLLNQETVSIISIEDPVEYRLPGVTQIQVNERSGLSFARGLRSLVRQDPDIVMIGEIRDRETAEIAIHASLTGHLVLSTLHTMSAAAAPLRLMDTLYRGRAGVLWQKLLRDA